MDEGNQINAALEPTFILGHFIFRLRSSDWALLNSVSNMLPSRHNAADFRMDSQFHVIDLDAPADIGDSKIVDLRVEGAPLAIAFILDTALRYHDQLAWLEGATMLQPDGLRTLLCGGTHSGKTTLALALNLLADWKMVSEDLTMIDLAEHRIVPFARPLSLRDGTAQRIFRATKKLPESNHMTAEWYFDPAMYHRQPVSLQLSMAVFLAPIDADQPGVLQVEKLSAASLVKHLLPLSNLVHKPEALNMVYEMLADAKCFSISGGQLEDRIAWLQDH